ncbi:nuclear transport factor 2 family protein [Pseudonocardia kujensis]|uniref:nuclear transport factor 2 family protein n=1 Tax=Pseudonocardia kujensis TaxID=1128675 RepID=UPI001E3B2CA1|nr:nuclear transport factor 2 family protein [Pseudonocardia kujensis]MCE0765763.1 nuclear transport factor 2 family protein [Pseudonocardia kujensis]
MPWFPDFAGAVELVRRETRSAGRADPVGQYLRALDGADTHALEDVWPGEVVIHDPRLGEVRGHRELRRFVARSRSLLEEHHARVETEGSVVVGNRAVVELLAHIRRDGQDLDWPVAVVAESAERSVVFRSYFSQRPLDGRHHLRSPVLGPGAVRVADVVERFRRALAAGDTDGVVGTFAPDGYFREPAGQRPTHRGGDELRSHFRRCFGAGGGIELQACAVTDDGARCALEYNLVRWGTRDLPPQAGLGVFDRGPDGLLAAARLYDDAEPPDDPPGAPA